MTLIPHELAMKAIAVDNDKRSAKETQKEREKERNNLRERGDCKYSSA